MKDPILFRRKDTLDPIDARYWKDLFYRIVKIGTELEVAPPKGMSRPDFENQTRTQLAPSGTLERLGQNGVLDVQPEHCGIEIRIIGRQPHFRTLYRQYQGIMAILLGQGARSRPTCGLHFHLLTPTLAEPVPEIILANLWNLTRRYGPELKFLTSGAKVGKACAGAASITATWSLCATPLVLSICPKSTRHSRKVIRCPSTRTS